MNKGQIPRLEMDSNNEKEQASVKKRVRRERRQLVAGELVQDFAQNTTLHGLRYIAEKRLSLVENSNNEKEQASVKKRVRRERRQLVAGELVQDFAQNTTLHGLRYIAEKRLSLVEKIFWTVSFVTSVSLCLMLIWNVWVKWQSAPIIVTVDDDYVSIQEVPFPDDTEDSMLYEAVCLILGLPNEMTPKPFNVRIVEKIFEVSPNIDDILHSCNLYGSIGDCKELFNPVLTMEGRSTYSRPDASIILKHENEDVSRFYNTNNDGFKVFLHHPADLPQSSVFFYAAPNEQRISLGLKLSITNTSSSLRTYAADTFTRIEMFYKTPKIVPMRRSELFGMTDFFANCGGLLGLFLGFSFLSILEIVYFCTLRLGCSFRRNTQPAENTTQKDEKRFDSSVSLNMLQAENITEKDEERDGSSLCQNAQQLENNTQTDEERLGGSPCLNTQQIEKNTEKNEEPY
ncbi:hypothetical protein MSG28_009550 [Choristoneura fumiferana]|uniref:Uncharacterized protein n=1 Tax=Choristoneura fumiferana TaxID=7141 RepID=A0ACC0JBL0_CHOFU|nr:hypothetical protein MSG28_009550 [Choristoneura fumiferana]